MFSGKNRTGIAKVRRDGVTYEIPVDRDGYVPVWAIIEHFQKVGGFVKDKARTSKLVLPQKLTPEDIVEWWKDPFSCDLDGIDTKDSPIYSVPASIRGRKRKALQNIAIISDRLESDRIKTVLAQSFTGKELQEMTRGESIYIKVVPHLRDCTGFYLRKQEGVDVPNITLERGTTPDGIVHEFTHHIKVMEGRSAFPTDKEGRLDSRKFCSLGKKERNDLVRKEERETVVETVIRTETDSNPSGYFETIPGKAPYGSYLHDQNVTSGGRIRKGASARRAFEKFYGKTDMCQALILNDNTKRKGRR